MPDLTYHQASESERQAGGMASRHCYAKDARQKMRDRRNNSRCADAKFRGLFRPAGKNPDDRKMNSRRGPATQCRSVLEGALLSDNTSPGAQNLDILTHANHSLRNAVIGSTADARLAGTRHARAATPSSKREAAKRMRGFVEAFSTH
jgi:hypothetical protein